MLKLRNGYPVRDSLLNLFILLNFNLLCNNVIKT